MASTASISEKRQISIGRIFQLAFSTTAHNPLVVLGLAFLLGALPSVIFSYFTTSFMTASVANGGSLYAVWGAGLFNWVISVVIAAIVQGALTRATVAEREGKRASFGECIAAGLRVFLPLIAVGLIYGISVGIGFVLLIVPGIIVMIVWSAAAPAIVVERDGVIASLGRSNELTRGSRWRIFGLFLVLLVIYLVFFTVVGLLAMKPMMANAVAGQFGIANVIIGVITSLAFNLLWGTIQPALYIELREAKEGGSIEHLEQVFA